MRRVTICILVLVLAVSFVSAQDHSRVSISVVTDPRTNFPDESATTSRYIAAALSRLGRFNVVERENITGIMRELEVTLLSGLMTPETQMRSGAFLGAEYQLLGHVSSLEVQRVRPRQGRPYYRAVADAVYALINIETASYAGAIQVTGTGTSSEGRQEARMNALREISSKVTADIRRLFPLQDLSGAALHVTHIDGLHVFLSSGRDAGIDSGTVFRVVRPNEGIDPSLSGSVGRLVVTDVAATSARGRIVSGSLPGPGDVLIDDTDYSLRRAYFGLITMLPTTGGSSGVGGGFVGAFDHPLRPWFIGGRFETAFVDDLKFFMNLGADFGFKAAVITPRFKLRPSVGPFVTIATQSVPSSSIKVIKEDYPTPGDTATSVGLGFDASLGATFEVADNVELFGALSFRLAPSLNEWKVKENRNNSDSDSFTVDNDLLTVDSYREDPFRLVLGVLFRPF